MWQRTVLLVASEECGWTDIRRALQSLSGVSILERSSTHEVRQAIVDHSPDLILMSQRFASNVFDDRASDFNSGATGSYRVAIIGSTPHPTSFPNPGGAELAGHLLWQALDSTNLHYVLSTLVHTDLILVSPDVAHRFVESLRPAADVPPLTELERMIVRRLSEGYNDKEITELEPVSVRTIERVVAKLLTALDIRSRFALGFEVARRRLLDRPAR